MYLTSKEKNIFVKRLTHLKKEMVYFFQLNLLNKPLFFEINCEKLKETIPPLIFNFPLDIFQKMAIKCVELEKNILIAAHTSSGKTLIAEYAIAKSINRKRKVIYTTPIKALSNQKYRDLCKIFSDVGLITGDISINPYGSCIVMTTEVLRCILGNKGEDLTELDWVIIDEAHYLKDLQRGVIWEEIIILLPKPVKIICLSATMPNILEFSEWLVKIRKRSFVSIVAQKRPVPLKEYFCLPELYGLELFKVNKINLDLKNKKFSNKLKPISVFSIDIKFKNNMKNLLNTLHEIKYGPIILFTFSKKKCHEFAQSLQSVSFCDKKCQLVVERFLDKLGTKWSEKELYNSSCKSYFELLKKGIGIHHADLSPLLKEITETLFHSNLLFVLFATETFSIGLNMPSKTVIFSSLVKFDGKNLRFLNRGEFIQMSGRAGRRGLDRKGIVISILDKNNNLNNLEKVLKGNSEPIGSVFRVTVNTFLDFISWGKYRLKKLIKNSFFEFQKKINTHKELLLYGISKKRNELLIVPKSTCANHILYSLELIEKSLNFKFIGCKISGFGKNLTTRANFNENKILKNYNILLNNNLFSVSPEKIQMNLKLILWRLYLKIRFSFNIIPLINGKLDISYYKNNQTIVHIVIICMEIMKLVFKHSLFFLWWVSSFFTINYRSECLKFGKHFKNSIINLSKNSIFSELPKFLNSFLKIGLLRKNCSLSLKGEICSKINYKENLVLLEWIYEGTIPTDSFPITVTLLIGLVCEEQCKDVSLHPTLFLPHQNLNSIVLKLYSTFEGSSLSIHLLKVIKRKKNIILNLMWARCNNFLINDNSKYSYLDKNVLKRYHDYVLKILEVITKIYQSLGNIFLASKFESFLFKLKIYSN